MDNGSTNPAFTEWANFEHDGITWSFDVTFLLSGSGCIWGKGCKGIYGSPNHGCCDLGAHFENDADLANTAQRVKELQDHPELWQYVREGTKRWDAKDGNERRTRVYNGACIFLNRDGHAKPGCAFHHLATVKGVHHTETKPDICGIIPLRIDHVTDTYRIVTSHDHEDWDRYDEGAKPLDWWCMDHQDEMHDPLPLFVRSTVELQKMLPLPLFNALMVYLNKRYAQLVADRASVEVTLTSKS